MKEIFEKIVRKLMDMKVVRVEQCHEDYELEVMVERDFDDGIEIVNQVAEEYGKDINAPYNDGWIPCSEKTPEFEIYAIKRMWVTMHKKGCGFHFSRQLRWNGCMGRWEWENGKTVSDGYEIVAWKPVDIPAPYQPKGE